MLNHILAAGKLGGYLIGWFYNNVINVRYRGRDQGQYLWPGMALNT